MDVGKVALQAHTKYKRWPTSHSSEVPGNSKADSSDLTNTIKSNCTEQIIETLNHSPIASTYRVHNVANMAADAVAAEIATAAADSSPCTQAPHARRTSSGCSQVHTAVLPRP